jgi:hypothetical protein
MKTTAIVLLAIAILALASCSLGTQNAYEIELYVSLGSASTLPAGAYHVLDNYWEKAVRFSVVGTEAGVNDDVNLAASGSMNWTGTGPSSGTQFATHTFSLKGTNGTYAGGTYKFRFYIDWNGNAMLDSGDVVMTSYQIIADKDNNPATGGEEVTPAEYGTAIVYNASDHSISIDDPCTYNSGFAWIVEKIHEGNIDYIP